MRLNKKQAWIMSRPFVKTCSIDDPMRVDLYDGRTFWVHGGTRRARVNLMYQLVAHLDEQELEGQQVEGD